MNDKKQLAKAIDDITEIAKGFGLDFYPMRYEICPPEIIYTFGAYGMPTRYSHWSFGKQFHRMKIQYDLGLSKIYELVINSNPCYAFLLNSNSLIQNKLIIAHVLAHCDFFKNNARFAYTNRNMVESMAATKERIQEYEKLHGESEVEAFIDAVLAIQEHVDPNSHRLKPLAKEEEISPGKSEYDDLWNLDTKKKYTKDLVKKVKKQKSEKDILLFLEEYSPELEDWQRDILTMMREEMLYFWPQLETKIMNEGWATFWHQRILRELDLNAEESLEFAKLHANVVQPSKTSINPYYLGVKLFEDIENRFEDEKEGREKLFEIREIESDISFLRNYLTKDFVEREDLYLFQKKDDKYTIVDNEWKQVREQLIQSRMNGGFPYITVEDGDYNKTGALFLKHQYEGIELDLPYLEKTLPYFYKLWGKQVVMETVVEDRLYHFTYDGDNVRKSKVN